MEIIKYDDSSSRLNKILKRRFEIDKNIQNKVKKIVSNVKLKGDKALFAYTEQFDGVKINKDNIIVEKDYFKQSLNKIDANIKQILKLAKENITAYHENQREDSWLKSFSNNVKLGQKITPLKRVGVYVPGGKAFYPSTALMNIIPAQVAGVKEIVVCTPPAGFQNNPLVAATLGLLGVEKAYLAGGAQAVAALAFGTESIPRVDKIVGPGNIYVALAKREVFGYVDIDMIAGPSEIVVLAQDCADPHWVALDLLSQAEHRTGYECALLLTDSLTLAEKVKEYIDSYLKDAQYKEIIKKTLAEFGGIILIDNMKQGVEVVNKIAPEHLEIIVENQEKVLSQVINAGAIFIGPFSSEPVGDYWAGPNHVLPTAGTARFFSPLGVYDFIKRSSLIYYTKEALLKNARFINDFALSENLYFHGRAVLKRYEDITKEE